MLGKHPKDVQVAVNFNLPEKGTFKVRINKDTEMDYSSGHHMHPSKTAAEETRLERKIPSLLSQSAPRVLRESCNIF